MQSLFKDYGIEIMKEEDKYFVQYETGEIATRMETIEISKEDAMKAEMGPNEAYNVIIKYQNIMMGLIDGNCD